MRVIATVLLAAALAGCAAGGPSATDSPTASPSATAEPTPEPTITPSPSPTGTRDPNATPSPTPLDLMPFLTSQITVVNLGDSRLALTVILVDPDSGDEYEIGAFGVEPLQVTTQSIPPTRYRLEFDYPGGSDADAGACTVDIADAEHLEFAALETGVAVTTGQREPADPAEMVVATASRCQAEAGA